jgi:hypothetical protein
LRRGSALLVLAAACTRVSAPPAPPAPSAVDPAAAYAGRDTPVLLRGDGFTPSATQQLGSGSHIEVDAGFRAFLGTVELVDVRWVDTHTISATVPAALPPGVYGLSIEGPYGRGSVDGVFQVDGAAPASLAATATAPARVLVDSDVPIAVTVSNSGVMSALAVSAGPAVVAGPPATLQPPPENVDIQGGASHLFTWHAQASAPGILELTLPFAGTDEVDHSIVSAQASASVRVVTPAHLTIASLTAPRSQPAGPAFDISVDVTNDGGSDALAVQFAALSAPAFVTVVSSPDPQDIPAGATRRFVWTVEGTDEGTATLGTSGAGIDSTGGAAVTIDPMQWTVIIFKAVALLYPSVLVAPGALPNETFTVSLQLDNPGIIDALSVQPSIAVSGTGGVTLQSTPPSATDVPAGQSVVFSWTYTASARGDVRFDLSAVGTDARSGNPVTASASGAMQIGDAVPVSSDPFADGSSFAYVFSYAGRVYLGPSGDGASAVRMNYDGTSPEMVRFGFQTDFGTIKNLVSPTPTAFPSLGSIGCTPDTLECGPDNEDGRGLFSSVVLSGTEWLFGAGARQSSLLKHVYLTTDTGTTPQFPFVAVNLGGGTRGTSAVAALGTALYVAFVDGGGSGSPVLLRMTGLPADSSQPVNPTLTIVPTPQALKSISTGMIDSMITFSGWLYAANDGSFVSGNAGGCSRYSGSTWVSCTPNNPEWTAKSPVVVTPFGKTSDFVPSDKAVPQMTPSGGRLYLARNTTAGPQLWGCNPSSNVCGPTEWNLVAANTSGDVQLSQMNVGGLTTVSLLVATSQHVYVGYDSPGGIQLYGSSDPTPSQISSFTLIAPAGLGAGLTQIVDARALSLGGREFLYIAARPGNGPVRVYRVAP